MAMEINAPTFPESIEEGTLAAWHKQPGEAVQRDEMLADIETDKVRDRDCPRPWPVALTEIVKAEGEDGTERRGDRAIRAGRRRCGTSPGAACRGSRRPRPRRLKWEISPAARKLAEERGIDITTLNGSGRGGRITKADVSVACRKHAVGQAGADARCRTGEPSRPGARGPPLILRPSPTAWNAGCR